MHLDQNFGQVKWRRAMDINITGPFLCARAVSPVMRRAKWGRIINISSGTVLYGRANYLHYIASKSALIGMTKALARAMGRDFITVNAILPGLVLTEAQHKSVSDDRMRDLIAEQALPRAARPDDMGKVVLFLASEASEWVTGQSISATGGRNMI